MTNNYIRVRNIGDLLRFVKKCEKFPKQNLKGIIGKVTKHSANIIQREHSIDIRDYIRIVDSSSLKHVLSGHPEIKLFDLLLISLITTEPDVMGLGKKENTIVYKKQISDTFFYVEFIRKGKKELVMQTFYKRKSRPK